ncbi:hypothetical protein [Tenacibaculum ovolyticum]|uniref:hypothetical protein n=1 Tax=Tenacibaculum ovolyticum TaxID=104270 RepID=UPI0005B84683|nr:hypothetical protein [Tenacibaculum ovolyticum]
MSKTLENIESKKIIDAIKWWESKRWVFNSLVGLSGVFGIVKGIHVATENIFVVSDILGIILSGIIANIFYSSGILVEILDNYYFNNKLKMERFREVFLVLGCISYCIYAYICTYFYYNLSFQR